MTIPFDENNIMQVALDRVARREYFDALCLFTQVDSYESMLNQVACLCALEDNGYAAAAYRRLLALYGATHNCIADLLSMGDVFGNLFAYFNYDRKSVFAYRRKKNNARGELLGYYYWLDMEDIEEEEEDDFDFQPHNPAQVHSGKSVFFDTKSDEYAQNVADRMLYNFMSGKFGVTQDLQKEFFSLRPKSTDLIEMQLLLATMSEKWQLAEEFALKLADRRDVSVKSLGIVAQTFCHTHTHLDVLEKVFKRIVEQCDDVNDDDLMRYIMYSAKTFGYNDITLELTDALCSHYLDAACSCLLMCAWVYFNFGDYDSATDAMLLMRRAAPWDGLSATLSEYIKENNGQKLSDPHSMFGMLAPINVPKELAEWAYKKLNDSDNLAIDKSNIHLLDCITRMSLCAANDEEDVLAFRYCLNLQRILEKATVADKEEFFRLAKCYLVFPYGTRDITAVYIMQLIRLGCRDKVAVSVNKTPYLLDLSKAVHPDPRYGNVLAICAAFYKTEPPRIAKIFEKLNSEGYIEPTTSDREIAYAILSIDYGKLADEEEAYFFDEDRELYKRYIGKK